MPELHHLERRLITIVAADLAEYSRLMAADEEGTIIRLQGARRSIIDPGLAKHGGRLIKTMGDGLLAEFPSPVAALRATIDILNNVAESQSDCANDQRLRFRVGINLGDVVIDGDDILGDGVNIAARLESLAPPGGICISRSVQDQVKGKVDADLTALGPQAVKNIPEPIEVWRVEMQGVIPALPASTETAKPSVVILPFDNMSADADQEFLADGIVEDVTTELSRFRTLTVIARNSAFSYRDTHKDVREIATELDVQYVVEGSVRRAGNRLRVTAQLIEAASGTHLWAERWDRTMEDLFDLQDELTQAIVAGVEPELGAHERALARARPSESLSAWELYQRAISEQVKYTGEGLKAANELLIEAILIDPEFAMAHAALARNSWIAVATGRSEDPAEALRNGIASARKAIEIDDRLEAAHLTLGVLLAITGAGPEAISHVEDAITLNPNNAECHHAMAMTCLFQRQPDATRIKHCAHAALRLNPRDPRVFLYYFLAQVGEWVESDFQPSETILGLHREASRRQNADWYVHLGAATTAVHLGKIEEAKSHLNNAMKRRPDLSVEMYRTAFPFPAWPLWFEKSSEQLEKLVKLGLPRE